MRQIKFRGIDAETGKPVYGDLIQRNDKTLIHERGTVAAKYVKPDTLAQLVYVKDGVEYFEGDTMIKGGREWQVELCMRWKEVTT